MGLWTSKVPTHDQTEYWSKDDQTDNWSKVTIRGIVDSSCNVYVPVKLRLHAHLHTCVCEWHTR